MSANISIDRLCQRMRSLVHDCLAKHMYESAIFYADKLVTMSNGAAADVYTLAEVMNSIRLLFCCYLVHMEITACISGMRRMCSVQQN